MKVQFQRKSTKAAAIAVVGAWGILAIIGLTVAYALAFALWVAVLDGGALLPIFFEFIEIAESLIGVHAPRWFYAVAFVAYLPMIGIAVWGRYGSKKTNQHED